MTEVAVDLTNLREATDGDAELEQELFAEFIDSSQQLLVELETIVLQGGDDESWRKAVHALKGISLNLGAGPLGTACKEGQDRCEENLENKKTMLQQIRALHMDVLNFLKAECEL